LEFDVAKILVAKGFSIDSDFTYSRKDSAASGVVKDFSVDIEALAFPPFDPKGNELHAQLQLLVECKYRYPKTKWLFLPDINGDLSSFTPGYTIRVVNQFSQYTLEKKSCYEYESNFPMCYKE
jgi:hypothetical protein